MTQEERQLLVTDLAPRLPYGVICNDSRHGDSRITEIDIVEETVYCDDFDEYVELDKCKPYLRPMSSMTEEEKKTFSSMSSHSIDCLHRFLSYSSEWYYFIHNEIDWLNAHHFDYRGLIEKGLALEAPEGMYNKKEANH